MPSLEEVLEFRKNMFDESVQIIKTKGHDYNREQQAKGDTLFNLRVCEMLSIVETAEKGILVRLCDKFMRLVSLTAPGVVEATKGERVLDTIKDIHNYVDYLGLLWLTRKYSNEAKGITAQSTCECSHDLHACRINPTPLPSIHETLRKLAGEAGS